VSVCWLNELWLSEFNKYRYFLKLLSEYDYIIVHWAGSVDAVQEVVQGKCVHLPYGIDAFLFCPVKNIDRRVIDVYSIGRRSEETHKALLRMMKENGLFYVFDTMEGYQVQNPMEHRYLLAQMAKRSRYFLVNPGKFNSLYETHGQSEFGNRYFEGAAAGTIMIGEAPKNEKFSKYFDWEDALIHMPYGSGDIEGVIRSLNKQPERQNRIRRNNIRQSLLRHDWVYRWEEILNITNIKPMPALIERKKILHNLAEVIPTDD
jgi:hypothetical protein